MSHKDRLEDTLKLLPGAWRGQYWSSLESTQDVARAAIANGAPPRSVFVADFQSAGRGRHGRVWLAPPGTSLLMSMVLEQSGPPSIWGSTALAAVALVEAIERLAPGPGLQIKWPNDVVVDGRKVAGILAESTWDGTRARAIVGVGVNVTSQPRDLDGLPNATSLLIEYAQRIDRGALLSLLLLQVDAWAARPEADLRAAWQARLWGHGQRLHMADVGGEQEVVVLGATTDGLLRVRLADGTERTTATGELML